MNMTAAEPASTKPRRDFFSKAEIIANDRRRLRASAAMRAMGSIIAHGGACTQLVSDGKGGQRHETHPEAVARISVEYADALLARLNTTP